MATSKQLAIVLDSARGWTACASDVNWLLQITYSTRRGLINTFPHVFCIYTPGRHRITNTYLSVGHKSLPIKTFQALIQRVTKDDVDS